MFGVRWPAPGNSIGPDIVSVLVAMHVALPGWAEHVNHCPTDMCKQVTKEFDV